MRVLEFADGVAGCYAGKLLADFGADVTKIEPVGGDPCRYWVAVPGDDPHREAGPRHLHLNTNKASVVGDVALVSRLAAGADLVIEDGRLDVAALRSAHPQLVVVSITPFGLTGPYAGWAGEEIVAYAMGGPMHATGVADREPSKLAGAIVQVQTGNSAAVAALAALRRAELTGRGAHVDVSAFETQASSIDRRGGYLMWHQFTGGEPVPRVGGHRAGLIPVGIYPTADGYVQLVAAPNWLTRLAALLGDDEVIERLQRPNWMDDAELPELLDGALHVWTLQRTSAEAMAEAQAAAIALTTVNAPVDLLEDPHFADRRFWADVDHPAAGGYRTPGAPFRMRDGWKLRCPAPLLDQHGDGVRSAVPAPRPGREPAPDQLPLAGIRVLDLTVVWAGPFCTMQLGDLGAEVIRLDNPNLFPTASRGATPRPRPGRTREAGPLWGAFPNDDPGERPWNRVGPFVVHARGKAGVTVDLRTALGRETFLRLVENSDVVVENNSAKVLGQLGLGWDVLHERNPSLIVVRMPSIGLEGPYSGYLGFGAHVEALCGLTVLRGYPDLDVSANTATYYMDPASGSAATFATLAALRRRDRSGEGELVEVAQAENLAQFVGDYLVDASRTGRRHGTIGNRHPTRAPQGVYPCAGEDRWAAISVGDDAQFRALAALAGIDDNRFATLGGRHEHHAELDRVVAAWTSDQDRWEVTLACQRVGIAAGPVLDEADLLADPHLAARGFFRTNGSADLGEWTFPGHLWRWDGPPFAWGPINRLGADNEAVYRGLLGLNDDEWAALDAEHHLSLDYVDADGNPF